ncbi:hypothetical protein BC941DRAFT_474125 [Chlamydoabsidia padenii]|nr:hypothetical protein BC941DRAFT_474125 [Chlamydoabsidia padenii]
MAALHKRLDHMEKEITSFRQQLNINNKPHNSSNLNTTNLNSTNTKPNNNSNNSPRTNNKPLAERYQTPESPTIPGTTDIDDSMISYFIFEVGLSVREINKVTDMCLGSISWRVKKGKLKYPNRRRNTDITAEWLDEFRKAWLKDRSHREILEAVKDLTIRNE